MSLAKASETASGSHLAPPPLPSVALKARAAVVRIWHTSDWQGQMPALAFR